MEAKAITNSDELIKNNPWLLEDNCKELIEIIEEADDYLFFDPSGSFGPSYCSHTYTGNECSIARLKELLESHKEPSHG
ncbi:hypothetical protein SJZ96_02115 [Acinetobacter baumannii]|nr:hypothetical protein [Acinetobacter baumannii]